MIKNSYVYQISIDGIVKYIGKGSGVPFKRMKVHIARANRLLALRKTGIKIWAPILTNHLAKAIKSGKKIEEFIVASNLSDEEAFNREKFEIENFEGELLNLRPGGLGGYKHSEETKLKMSKKAKERYLTKEGFERLNKASALANTKEHREKSRQLLLLKSKDENYILNLSRQQRRKWNNPDAAKRMKLGLQLGRKTMAKRRIEASL